MISEWVLLGKDCLKDKLTAFLGDSLLTIGMISSGTSSSIGLVAYLIGGTEMDFDPSVFGAISITLSAFFATISKLETGGFLSSMKGLSFWSVKDSL